MADRADDGSVDDDEVLWRRIYPDWIERDAAGGARPRSMAFLDRRSGEISVHRAHMTTETFVIRSHPTHGIAALKAKVPRELGYAVVPDPIKNETGVDDDPSHAVLVPPSGAGSKRVKALARQLAEAATLVREPVAATSAAPPTSEE